MSSTATVPRTHVARSRAGLRAALLLLRARAIFVLIVLVALFSAMAPSFLTPNNLAILTKHVAISAILAIGMTFVVLTGGIDLSVGSLAGLSGMVIGATITEGIGFGATRHFPPVLVGMLIAIAVCVVVGLMNGWLVTKAGVAPFIATLGTLYIARGAALLISDGKTFPNLAGEASRGNTGFPQLGQRFLLGLPMPVWIMLVLFGIAVFIALKTPLGRQVYAVGGNERAARLVGIQVSRVKLFTYVASAFCASLVGLIIASQLEAAHPSSDFDAHWGHGRVTPDQFVREVYRDTRAK